MCSEGYSSCPVCVYHLEHMMSLFCLHRMPPTSPEPQNMDTNEIRASWTCTISTKNALFTSYGTFICLLRGHIHNINGRMYLTIARACT